MPLHNVCISIIVTFNLLVLLPRNVICTISPRYVHHKCTRSSNGSYAPGSTFEENLNTTLLAANKASLIGFSKQTTGEGSNQVYSVLYCQGDIKGQDCRDCSEAAGTNILQKCYLHKEAIIWYDECTLHLSDNEGVVFSTDGVSTSPNHGSYNFSGVLKKLDHEKSTFEKLMDGLIVEAVIVDDDNDGMLQGYATGEAPLLSLSQEMTLGGVVQCRPDLLSRACDTCLRSALKQMDGWSTTMVFLPSCNLRFDLYPSQIGESPTSSGGGGGSIPMKILLPAAVVVGVVLIFGIACLVIFCRRKKQQRNKTPINNVLHRGANDEPSRAHTTLDVRENMGYTSTSQTTGQSPFWYATPRQSPEPSAPPIPDEAHVYDQWL